MIANQPEGQRSNQADGLNRIRASRVSAVDRLEILRIGANGNIVNFRDSSDQVLGAHGMVYSTTIHISFGRPIKGEGKTIELAHEAAADELVARLTDGSVIFSPKGKLEYHRNHKDKFKKKSR